jgi:hypothetical protein
MKFYHSTIRPDKNIYNRLIAEPEHTGTHKQFSIELIPRIEGHTYRYLGRFLAVRISSRRGTPKGTLDRWR